MKYAISCILTLLTKKNTYRYGDSIAKCRVSRILAHTPYPFAPTPRYLPAVRVYLQCARPSRAARYSCLTLLRETTVVWSCEMHGA